MESKTKHRILGVIVMAGIAVLMYPILQANTDKLADEQKLVKAPVFPDQAIQVSAETAKPDVIPGDYQISSDSLEVSNNTSPDIPNDTQGAAEERHMPGPMSSKDDHEQCVIIDVRPSNLSNAAEKITKTTTKVSATKKKHKVHSQKNVTAKLKKKPKSAQKPIIYSKINDRKLINSYQQQPLDENGLLQLKKAAWVIQLGSFKDKANALKLANQLRSKGYRAFIQNYSASTGQHTRVFVGPESQQKSARLVAAELKKGMRLHGIVISYKPFTL